MFTKIITVLSNLNFKIKIAVLAGIILAVAVYIFVIKNAGTVDISLVRGVPTDAAFIIQAKNLSDILDSFNPKNSIWKALISVPDVKDLAKKIAFLKSITEASAEMKDFISDKQFQISAHPTRNKETAYLFEIAIPKISEFNDFKSALKKWLDKRAKFEKRSGKGCTYWDISLQGESFCIAFAKGRAIFCYSTNLMEKALTQLAGDENFLQDKAFQKVASTSGKTAEINLYLNYSNLGKLLKGYTENDYLNTPNLLENYAEWAEMDVNIKDDAILFNGYIAADSLQQHYLWALTTQEPFRTHIETMLPQSTAAFYCLSLSDVPKYKNTYQRYLENSNALSAHLEKIAKVKVDCEIDPEEFIFSNLKSEVVLCYTQPERESTQNNSLIILDIKDPAGALGVLLKVLDNKSKSESKSMKSYSTVYQSNTETKHTIYNWPSQNFIGAVLGGVFSTPETNYFTFYGDYLIWGNSINALSMYLNEMDSQRNLSNDASYIDFSGSLASESNLFIYVNPAFSSSAITNYLTKIKADQYRKNQSAFGRLQGIAIQFSAEKELLRSNMLIKTSTSNNRQSLTKWECKLDGDVELKPQIVVNHLTNEKEIFVQDSKYKIYLISSLGKILWNKKIADPIISQVYQIDFMNNNRLQYLFNTENALYLLDRNGNNVPPYPIKLKSTATNGLSVFDYDNTKNYRILLATENKRVVALSKNGKLLDEWEFKETDGTVSGEIQYIKDDGNDYILFSDDVKNYFLNRKGETRLKPSKLFAKSSNNPFFYQKGNKESASSLVYTDNDGSVIQQFFDGKTQCKFKNNYTSNHYFIYADLNGNGTNEYLLVSNNKLEVFDNSFKSYFSNKFSNDIIQRPKIFQFSGGKCKIGLVSDQKVYLINNDGQFFPGFPLKGSTSFSLGYFGKSNRKFHIIVGVEPKSLVCYELN